MTAVTRRSGGDVRGSSVVFQPAQVVMAGLLAAGAPLVLLFFNTDWFFTVEFFLDPWHYVGFFREYLNPNYSPGAYKLARLPWILAGYVTNSLLPPLPATYTLHASFLCATSLALFLGLYALLRRLALASVVAIALGFYVHAHGSGGWDYHNTGAGAFYLLTFMLLALPGAVAGRRGPLMLAGAMAALSVHANITLVNFLPVLAFVHLRSVQLQAGEPLRVRAVVVRAGWCLLGAVLVTVLLGLINWWVGREFLFFSVLVDITARYVADSNYVAPWRHGSGWLFTAAHLALPAAVFVVGAASFALRYRAEAHPSDRLAASLVLQFLVMALVWIGWQMAGQLALDWNYFAYVLIPSCFVALGGLVYPAWPAWCERHWLATSLCVSAAFAASLSGVLDPYAQHVNAMMASRVFVVGGVLFATGLGIYCGRPRVATGVVLVATLAVGNRLVAGAPEVYSWRDPCKLQSRVYEAVVDSASWLETVDPAYVRVRTWFDQNEEIQPISGCHVSVGLMSGGITTMAFVQYVTRPWPMPGIEAVPGADVQNLANSNGVLAIISSRSEPLEAWSRRLQAMGLTYREIARHFVPMIASGFTIHAWELVPKVPEDVRFGAPIITVTDKTPLSINVYGLPKGKVIPEGDRVVFRPTEARDHASSSFAKISAPATDSWARLTVEPAAPNPPSCRVIVQTDNFNVVATAQCNAQTRYIKLPSNISSIRVYLTDPTRRPIILPRKIEIAISESTQ